jgi:hypothetical protein
LAASRERRNQRDEEQREKAGAASAGVDPRTGLKVPTPGVARPGDPVGRGAYLASQGESDGDREPVGSAKGLSESANKIAGLASGIIKKNEAEARKVRALANPSLFGGVSDKAIKDRLVEQRNAINELNINRKRLKDSGNAVYYGVKSEQIRRAQKNEGDFEGGKNRVPGTVDVDDVRSKDELLSWLTDDVVFGQIKKRMQDAGFAVETYDEVAKLWEASVKDAAAAYSSVGKKVTPWAILSLRAKNLGKDGKAAAKTTTSTTIEDLDPAVVRLTLEEATAKLLDRAPTDDELDDFIAKAQLIAKQNPRVTKTTTQYDFAGDPTSQTSTSTGGMDVVSARAQTAADDALKQDEEYGALQAAGYYMPGMFDALASPV